MSIKAVLARITDDLAADQVHVTLTPTDGGVVIKAGDYADMLIARYELKRRGIVYVR